MKNEILRIILKPRDERSVPENVSLINFWGFANNQEAKYGLMLSKVFDLSAEAELNKNREQELIQEANRLAENIN